MIDYSLVAIIVLLVLLVALWRYSVGRFRMLEQKITELTGVKEDLQRLLVQDDTLIDKKTGQVKKQAAVPTAEEAPAEEAEDQRPKAPLVPMSARQPAVVKKQPPMVVAANENTKEIPASGNEEEETVAVIMAAIAAYGYPPSAIRSIRPHRQKKDQRRNWALAARLGGMSR